MTNRGKLLRALADLESVITDEAISPTPYEHLFQAAGHLRSAMKFVLDTKERDGVKAA